MKDDERYPRNDRAAYGEMIRAAAAAVEKDKDARWEAARRHVRAGSVPPDLPFQDGDPTAYDPERGAYCPTRLGDGYYTEPGTEHASHELKSTIANELAQTRRLHEQFHADHRIHRINSDATDQRQQERRKERLIDWAFGLFIGAGVLALALQYFGVFKQ
jgi:hypothetical protein